MSIFWSEIAKQITPYVPGEQPRDKKYIKLNTNENPYPPSPEVIKAIRKAANEDLRLYPDPDCNELRCVIAEYFTLSKDQVFIGNGSDEILAFSFPAFFNPKKPILFPDITYSFYTVYAKLFHIDYHLIPLDHEFSIPVDQLTKKNFGIIFPNPNAPTGKYLPIEKIKHVLEKNKEVMVIIDEAYIDFGGKSAVSLLSQYPNLLIIQTLSKSRSLAGLRLGFALGHKDLIEGLNRVKNSFNSYTIDRLALACAKEAIKDTTYFNNIRNKIITTREQTANQLIDFGFKVIDSKANFLFITHPVHPAEKLFSQLKEWGILVRYFKTPRIDNYLRVTIGSDEQMDTFLTTVQKLLP